MTDHETDSDWMGRALVLAQQAADAGEVPVGAVLVRDGELLGSGWNAPVSTSDPSAHAELRALRAAAAHLGNYRLPGSTLYVTIEPCTMCFGALMHARVARLVYGAAEPRAGVCESQLRLPQARFYNHRIEVCAGVRAEEAAGLLRAFFAARRQSGNRGNP